MGGQLRDEACTAAAIRERSVGGRASEPPPPPCLRNMARFNRASNWTRVWSADATDDAGTASVVGSIGQAWLTRECRRRMVALGRIGCRAAGPLPAAAAATIAPINGLSQCTKAVCDFAVIAPCDVIRTTVPSIDLVNNRIDLGDGSRCAPANEPIVVTPSTRTRTARASPQSTTRRDRPPPRPIDYRNRPPAATDQSPQPEPNLVSPTMRD